jgi:hypothetical protein
MFVILLFCLLPSVSFAADLQDLVSASNDFEVEMIEHEHVLERCPKLDTEYDGVLRTGRACSSSRHLFLLSVHLRNSKDVFVREVLHVREIARAVWNMSVDNGPEHGLAIRFSLAVFREARFCAFR